MWRFDDTMETAKAIIRTFEEKDDIVLALQEEMTLGKMLESTSAGSYVIGERKNDEQRLSTFLGDDDKKAEVESLRHSIHQRIADEPILKEDVAAKVQEDIKKATEELKKENRKKTVTSVISWLFQIGSITANVVTAVLHN